MIVWEGVKIDLIDIFHSELLSSLQGRMLMFIRLLFKWFRTKEKWPRTKHSIVQIKAKVVKDKGRCG